MYRQAFQSTRRQASSLHASEQIAPTASDIFRQGCPARLYILAAC